MGNAATAMLASTEQVFHLSYRIDEGNTDSREQGDERGRLGRKMSVHGGMELAEKSCAWTPLGSELSLSAPPCMLFLYWGKVECIKG